MLFCGSVNTYYMYISAKLPKTTIKSKIPKMSIKYLAQELANEMHRTGLKTKVMKGYHFRCFYSKVIIELVRYLDKHLQIFVDLFF